MGNFLIKFCPLEYDLIISAHKDGRRVIAADLVETIAYHSSNTAFQMPEFRKALADYRHYKCRTPNKHEFSLDEEIQAIQHRLNIKD